MNHFQPQPAGLPSGSFGGRRSATISAPSLRRLLAARLLRVPLAAVVVGLMLALVGLHTGHLVGHLVAVLGLAAVAVGLGLLAGLVGLTWLEHRHKLARPTPAAMAAAGLLLLAVAAWGGAVALALGRAPWLQGTL